MKLIQMNAWAWRLYWPLRRFLERERPDFLLAQEALDAPRHAMADHYTTQGIVAEGLLTHALQSPGKVYDLRGGQERRLGMAILGRLPLQQVNIIDVPPPDAIAADPQLRYYQLLHATATVNGKTLNLLTCHGRLGVDISGSKGKAHYGEDDTVPGEPRLGNPRSEADFAKVAAYIDTLAGPTILTGDFNLWPQARALQPLTRRLRNLVGPEHMPFGRSALAWKTEEIVSHCFVSDEIRVMDFHIASDLVSDHQPLILEFEL